MAFALRPTYRRLVEFNPGYCAEARTLFAAMTVQPTRGRKARINEFINRLKAASIWTKIDIMYVPAAHDEQAARLNWKAPGSFTLTAVNSPTFATDRGFTGNGTSSYLDTGWDPGTNAVYYTQNDAHNAVYPSTPTTATGLSSGTDPKVVPRAGSGANSSATMNCNTAVVAPAGGRSQPYIQGMRRVSTDELLFRDGLQVATSAQASVALVTVDLNLIRRNSNFTTVGAAGIVHIGAALSDTEALDDFNAARAYMLAVGADT